MANIVITTSGSSIVVDFGDYYNATSRVDFTKASYHKNNVAEVHLHSDHVSVDMTAVPEEWKLTHDSAYSGADFFIVDSVSSVQPSSLSDLFDKITALR